MNRTAILVYHRIGDGDAFHDVSQATFAAHLQAIRRRSGGPELILSFDDGTTGHWLAAAMLEDTGLRGLFFISPARLDAPGRLTGDQARQLAERGHRLGGHGMSHRRFDGMTVEECLDELRRSRDTLSQLSGTPVEWLAPPGGMERPYLAELSAQAGYRYIRTMEWGYADGRDLSHASVFPITRRTSPATFTKVIEGRAPDWPWRLKRLARGLVGDAAWTWLRERFG